MNGSFEIITEPNGFIHHSSGCPVVIIFDSTKAEEKPPGEITWQEPVIGLGINTPADGKRRN